MDGQISFWKKHKKIIEKIIVVASTLFFVLVLIVFNQKINFLIGNEMIIYLSPLEKSFSMHYGNSSKAEFNISLGNVAYCRAACAYSFNDRSRNEVIDGGNFEIGKDENIVKSYELSVKRLGSGQDIYSFDVRCRTINFFLCTNHSDEKYRSSLVIVNYDLTETEKGLKNSLRQNVTELLEMLADADVMRQKISQKYFQLGLKVNLANLSGKKIEIDGIYDKTRISIENLQSLWSTENYVSLSQLFGKNFFQNLSSIERSIKELNESIDNIVELHNAALLKLAEISGNLNELNELNGFANISDELEINIKNFNSLAYSLEKLYFGNYSEIADEIGNMTAMDKLLIEKSKNLSSPIFLNLIYAIKRGNDLLCSLKQDCKENITVLDVIKSAEKFKKFIENYPISGANSFRQSCSSLMELNAAYSSVRNETNEMLNNMGASFPSDDKFFNATKIYEDNEMRKLNNSYYESFEKIVLEENISPYLLNIINSTLPKNIANITQAIPLAYNQSVNLSLNLSLALLSKINLSSEASRFLEACSRLGQPPREKINYFNIRFFNFSPISLNIDYRIASRIDTKLSDNPPICCVFNECKPCCRNESCNNEPKSFPVVFVHGHSVARANSPEFSLDAFNKLQFKLQDDGYLNAGILIYSGEQLSGKNEWGLSGKPVSVKVTYYYDIYRENEKYTSIPTKSESIDTYALRLNDIVNAVKEKTGKPKVNIIAFSMGGLVARKYVQIFGGGNVDKLITIASPNKGIIGQAAELCPLLGESKECTDMQQNSLFLNKLNDPSKQAQASTVKLYSIIGRGCFKDGKDGDGDVFAEQASLSGIANAEEFFVNGSCSGVFGQFHTDLLDIDKYPETYKIVSSVLNK